MLIIFIVIQIKPTSFWNCVLICTWLGACDNKFMILKSQPSRFGIINKIMLWKWIRVKDRPKPPYNPTWWKESFERFRKGPSLLINAKSLIFSHWNESKMSFISSFILVKNTIKVVVLIRVKNFWLSDRNLKIAVRKHFQ